VHIVQLANFYGPRSGGLRTALHHLGAGYVTRGHIERRALSRTRAEQFTWPAAVSGMLAAMGEGTAEP
jgi:alpha-1,6-mannosyltransferase